MLNLRLIPVVVFAAACLLALKATGFVTVGSAQKAKSWSLSGEIWSRIAGGAKSDDLIITGATPEKKSDAKQPAMAALPKGADAGKGQKSQADGVQSPAERALLERLQERRQELEARARDLELRESLLKAAEKQLDGRIDELKGLEGSGGEASDRIKSLVVMYEAMGPKEAARIFDRLDARTLVELVDRMNPRKVAEIMAKMQPEAAERMTLELARRRGGEKALPPTDLPRIGAGAAR
jgi:flagellar motility protein MotE (MotC chaperone)